MDRVARFFRRRQPTPPPVSVEPRCDFNAVGRCVFAKGHGVWHRNENGQEWYGVDFDSPHAGVPAASSHD